MELIEARCRAAVLELNLKLHLIADHGLIADGTGRPDPGSAPSPVGLASREPSRLEGFTSVLPQDCFIGHLAALHALRTPQRRGQGVS